MLGLTFFFVGVFFNKFGKRELEYYSDQKVELTKNQIIVLRLVFSIVGLVMLGISLYNLIEW
jgi:hypothetical protein